MIDARYRFPEAMVSTAWLEDNLADPALRIFDCTTYLVYEEGSDRPYTPVSGRADHDQGHIPGAGFLDLQGELSDPGSPFFFTMPAADRLAETVSQRGIGEGTRVVLYSRKTIQWATRVWWMLRAIGFDDAAILDGGWDKWALEGRPQSDAPNAYPPARLVARPRSGLFVGKEEIRAAIGDPAACTINALTTELHRGENSRYGRPGRVPGSVNVPAAGLLDPETRTLPSPEVAAQAFTDVGTDSSKRMLVYCGGGIAATVDAFLLHQLGFDDIAVYDNSMSEWAKDESLPIEQG